MAITLEQKERLLALPPEKKTKMLETLRKLFPQQKLSTEPVEKPAGIMPEDAANYGLKSD
jgi:hypothetical protein